MSKKRTVTRASSNGRRPGRRQGTSLSTRERIINAALEVFLGKGYDEATFADIAEKADVKKSTLYHHFSRKGEIFLEAHLAWLRKAIQDRRTAIAGAQSAPEKLRASLRASIRAYDRRLSSLFTPFVHKRRLHPVFGKDPRTSEIEQLQQEAAELTESVIWQGIAQGQFAPVPVPLAAFAIAGILTHAVQAKDLVPGLPSDLDQLADLTCELVLRMLGYSELPSESPGVQHSQTEVAPR
jgi:AcrR family transcriptional regulator